MKAGDFTTLANVKAWLNTGSATFPATDDALLGRMITAATRFIITWLSRDIAAKDYTETFNGNGGSRLFPFNYPIIGVSSLSVNGTAVTAQSGGPLSTGFQFDKEAIAVFGCIFPNGFQNISCSYVAGYQATNEPATIPDDNKFLIPVATLARPWVTDRGITLANGIALTKVTGNTVTAGQYSIVEQNGVFNYLFSGTDAAANPDILVTYGYCPEDLEQALIEMIGEKYSTRERIGQVSKSFGGEVVAFSQKDFNANAADVFNQYKNVVPV